MKRGPYRSGRKGKMLRLVSAVDAMRRDWYSHNPWWRPSPRLIEQTRRQIAAIRAALDDLESSL